MKITLNRALALVAISLVAFILIITIFAFVSKRAFPGKNIRTPDPSPESILDEKSVNGKALASFTELGKLRAVTKRDETIKDDIGSPLVIVPWLSYEKGDTAFYEELANKSTMLRALITNYFSNYTQAELIARGEKKIKSDLLAEINARLSLNKIEAIYFSDYIFLD